MTLLSKVKTLIDYAKFGMFFCEREKGKNAPLHFPRAITTYKKDWANGWNIYATKITGHLKTFGGTNCVGGNTPIVEIDLPELTNASGAWAATNYDNYTLKTCKLPSLRVVPNGHLRNFYALEYLEYGALVEFWNESIKNCTSLHTLVVGKGTACNLFLYHSEAYTQECLHNIIDNLAELKGVSYKLHIGTVNLAKISPEYLKKLENKGWSYA